MQYKQDLEGEEIYLNYIRNRQKQEIDFVLSSKNEADMLIEVKVNDNKLSPGLKYFKKYFPDARTVQLVQNINQEKEIEGTSILNAANWLSKLSA